MRAQHSRRLVLGAVLAQLPLSLTAGRAFAQFNLGDFFNRAIGNRPTEGVPGAGLSQGEIGAGLKDVLKVSSRRVIGQLSKPDGYYGDPAIRIPLPGPLQRIRQPLAMVGAAGMLDDLSLRMNRGAEKAAPKALNILVDAASNITFDDARQILTGPQDSVTQYFRRTSTAPMTTQFTPIMDSALEGAGATRVMQSVRDRAQAIPMLGMLGQGGMGQSGTMQSLMNFDLTGFAVGAALEGIFHYLGQQEADIRANPAARSTALLRRLFG